MINYKKITLGILPHWCPVEPPVGLACLKSYLEKFNYAVTIRDYNIELFHEIYAENKKLFDDHFYQHWFKDEDYNTNVYPVIKDYIKKWAEEIVNSDIGIIGFSLYVSNLQTTLSVIKLVKELDPQKIIILGAAEAATAFNYKVKEDMIPYTDYLVPGEGEEVLKELADCINNNEKIETIKGIYYKKNNQFEYTGKRPNIRSLDELPIPALDSFPLTYYENLRIPIIGSRGCINRCSFCSEFPLLGRYRSKSGERIYEEFIYYINKSEHEKLEFVLIDSLVNGKIRELEAFCDLMIKNNIKNKYNIEWSGKASIRKEMTTELLHKLAGSGCSNLYYGLESASQKVLNDMNKKFDIELASRVIKDTYEAGINNVLFLIIGFPTETEDDFQQTLAFLTDHAKYIYNVHGGEGCCVAANTDLYDNPDKYGVYWKNDDWYSSHSSPEIRIDRLKRIHDHCKSLNLKIQGWSKPEQ